MKRSNFLKSHWITMVFIGCIILFVVRSSLYQLKGSYKINVENRNLLSKLGASSISSLDVPVASIVLYNDSVLGVGYNTVTRDSDITGHAEINALNDVVKKIGMRHFKSIRDSIRLITTYEPCQMCKGVLLEYDVKNIVFMKGKGLGHWLQNDWKDFKYELRKRQSLEEGTLQDSLFRLYPNVKP